MKNRLDPKLLPAALLVALVACSSVHRYMDPNMDFGSVKTVAVMPFANLSRDNLAGDRVRDVFANNLLATGAVYVLPLGEVSRAIGRVGLASAVAPSSEEVIKLCAMLKADAVITGVVKEYGEVRSGTAAANVVSVTTQMLEGTTGKVVWSASTTKGGVGLKDRMLGGGGSPLNDVTETAVDDLINKLLK
jgi:polysaccharide biosynthesis protein PelC